ncbi:MAG: hemoglobin [Blastocatellia bacterium]|jgi:hemoglobin|nr:hemoglobin [Blastocatellia bacterium]
MRKIMKLLLATCLLAALAAAATTTTAQVAKEGHSSLDGKPNASRAIAQRSLYERLGGLAALQAVVDEFVGRVAADSRINGKFAKSDMPRLKLHLVEQLCAATGGPCEYTGRDMVKTHKNMKVTEGEFDALVEDLVAALDKFHVASPENDELLGILGPLKNQIVEVKTDAIGAPLPADFKPAPALNASQIAAGPKMKKMKSADKKKGKM